MKNFSNCKHIVFLFIYLFKRRGNEQQKHESMIVYTLFIVMFVLLRKFVSFQFFNEEKKHQME